MDLGTELSDLAEWLNEEEKEWKKPRMSPWVLEKMDG